MKKRVDRENIKINGDVNIHYHEYNDNREVNDVPNKKKQDQTDSKTGKKSFSEWWGSVADSLTIWSNLRGILVTSLIAVLAFLGINIDINSSTSKTEIDTKKEEVKSDDVDISIEEASENVTIKNDMDSEKGVVYENTKVTQIIDNEDSENTKSAKKKTKNKQHKKNKDQVVEESVRNDGIVRNKDWTFVIKDPNWTPDPTEANLVENDVLLRSYDISEMNVPLNEKFVTWDSPKYDCLYSREDREKYESISNKRKELNDRKEDAKKYIYQEEWIDAAPKDYEYLECIKGLEELGEAEYLYRKGSYKAFFDAANDYLRLAMEYRVQTNNVEAVTFYYAKSIDCTMKAFPYAQRDDVKWSETYDFLYERYHEIADLRTPTSEEDKMRAEKICKLLQRWKKSNDL